MSYSCVDENRFKELNPWWTLLPFTVLESVVSLWVSLGENSDLHLLDLFCGEGNMGQAFIESGLSAVRIDILIKSCFDILRDDGYALIIYLTLRLKPLVGILFAGPPCKSWIWMSRGHTGRRSSGNVAGDVTRYDVQAANEICRRVYVLLTICVHRNIKYIIEQPMTTLLWDMEPLSTFLANHEHTRTFAWLGYF
eukprot:5239554-Karenia_brevis.AAC.1